MHLQAWRLEGLRASIETSAWRVALDVARPEEGLVATTLHQPQVEVGHVLGVLLPQTNGSGAPIADCYVRGADLVATYTMPAVATRVQVYWRCVGDESDSDHAAAFDLQVSVQTDVLDAHPRLSTRSKLPARDIEGFVRADTARLGRVALDDAGELALPSEVDGTCLLFRLRGGEGENAESFYFEMAHPADFSGCRLSRRDDSTVVEHELFTERSLEKGVLMRARLRGMLIRGADDLERAARAAYDRFVAAPLPLTT